ncbi:MAG: hypothetical protein EA420_03390 [Candidatus Competibacteraceae bacterium]|nr:MAG: hypothetical protein EA420_03390 [Candidatus Competibacteraceae bacterium]
MATETVALSTSAAHSTTITRDAGAFAISLVATFPAEAGTCRLQVRAHDADRWLNLAEVSVAASGRTGFSVIGWQWARLQMVLNQNTGDATVDSQQIAIS